MHLHETKPWAIRSSHQRCSVKNVFLKISQNAQENTCARVSFLNFAKFLRTPFSQNTFGRLLLDSFFKNRNVSQYFPVLGERIKICEICEIFCVSMQQSFFSTYVEKIFDMQITEYQLRTLSQINSIQLIGVFLT